jgi:hypothetical protein
MEYLMTREDVMAIPEKYLPMMVFSDNLRSLLSWGIKVHEEGNYNHFMWLIRPGTIASQNMLFQKQPVRDYFAKYRMKFWYCPYWTPEQRKTLIDAIEADLAQPWYKRVYDCLAIVGQALHLDFLQTPGIDICSDKGGYLKLVDLYYDLNHPDPEEINRWLMTQKRYKVYGRYMPD